MEWWGTRGDIWINVCAMWYGKVLWCGRVRCGLVAFAVIMVMYVGGVVVGRCRAVGCGDDVGWGCVVGWGWGGRVWYVGLRWGGGGRVGVLPEGL